MSRSFLLASVVWLAVSASAVPAIAESGRADRALSYMRERGSDAVEWRIIDPFTGVDTLLRTTPDEPTGVRWDSTLRTVEFVVADTVYRAPWKLGARAKPVARLPAGKPICEFSFDLAAGLWRLRRFERPRESDEPTDAPPMMCPRERWVSRDGFAWSLESRDSVVCYEDQSGCPYEDVPPNEPGHFLTPDELAPPMDLSTGTQIDPDSGGITMLVPLHGAPGRALQMDDEVRAPEEDCTGTPFYWVDTRTGNRKLVLGSGELYEGVCATASEACGFVLLASGGTNRLIDATTGDDVLPLPSTDHAMFWAPRLGR